MVVFFFYTSTYYDASSPRVEQKQGTDQKGAGKHNTDGKEKPVAQSDILLPKEERVAVGVGGKALSAVVVADCPHALDGLHKLRGLPEPVEVEGELCVFDGLGSWNWTEKQ